MITRLFLILSVSCVSSFVMAQENIEGEYTRQTNNCFVSAASPGGWECEAPLEEGVAIKRRNHDSYYLFLKTRGANGHFCEYTGIARWKDNALVSTSKEHNCKVSVTVDGTSASFKSEGDECYFYCGARATLNAGDLKRKLHRVKQGRNG